MPRSTGYFIHLKIDHFLKYKNSSCASLYHKLMILMIMIYETQLMN